MRRPWGSETYENAAFGVLRSCKPYENAACGAHGAVPGIANPMGIQHAAPLGLTFPGHRRILLGIALARGVPIPPPRAPPPAVRSARRRQLLRFSTQPHCWRQRQPSGETRTPRRPSRLPRIASASGSPTAKLKYRRDTHSVRGSPKAKLKPRRDTHSVCALLAPAGAQRRTRTRTQSKAPLDRGVGG